MSTLDWGDAEGCECLGCSNWVICSRLSPFCSEIFQTFSLSYWGGQFLLPQRANRERRDILPTSKLNETLGFECLGHQSWTILSLFSKKITKNITPPRPLYWGSLFLLPQRAEKGQRVKRCQQHPVLPGGLHPSTNRAQHCLTSVIG